MLGQVFSDLRRLDTTEGLVLFFLPDMSLGGFISPSDSLCSE